jgi:hypothetical protein
MSSAAFNASTSAPHAPPEIKDVRPCSLSAKLVMAYAMLHLVSSASAVVKASTSASRLRQNVCRVRTAPSPDKSVVAHDILPRGKHMIYLIFFAMFEKNHFELLCYLNKNNSIFVLLPSLHQKHVHTLEKSRDE